MRLVSKNKDEGTELFKGAVDVAQFRAAAARYNKALTHASKFVDLSPDQREEVNAMKLSLHLNVAACWLKITDADNHLDQVRWGHHRRDKGGVPLPPASTAHGCPAARHATNLSKVPWAILWPTAYWQPPSMAPTLQS